MEIAWGGRERPAAGMAWAVDASSRRPVYVGDLQREQTGLRCGCICPACDAKLQAVGAGSDGRSARAPFFRHHVAQQGPGCKYRVAELAALKLLVEKGVIEIPAPRRKGVHVGLSGALYEAEVVGSPVRERIIERRLVSETQAVLTLESGRQVALVLRGHQDVGELGSVFAVVQVQVDDPEVAWLTPEEIVARSELTGGWLHTLTHAEDVALLRQAEDDARQKALDQLDVDPESLDLAVGATKKQASESLIHWAVKDALMNLRRLQAPALRQVVTSVDKRGQAHSVVVALPATMLQVSEVADEVLFEGYRPDIVCMAREVDQSRDQPRQWFRLVVEVAVTNHVGVEKLAMLRRDDVASVELDVTNFANGGAVTRPQLRDLVASDLESKVWLHHPLAASLVAAAEAKTKAAVDEANAAVDRERARVREQEYLEQERVAAEKEREGLKQAWADGLSSQDAAGELRWLLNRRWAGLGESTSNGLTWLPGEFERAVSRKLEMGGAFARVLQKGGVAQKLEAIVNSAATRRRPLDVREVLGLGSTYLPSDLVPWLGLLHMCVEHCGSMISPDNHPAYEAQRSEVMGSLSEGQTKFARQAGMDKLLSEMFPQLREVFDLELGTRRYSERVKKEREEEARKAAAEKAERDALQALEAEEREAEAAAERERGRLSEEIDMVVYQWTWKANKSVPPTADDAVKYLDLMGHKSPDEKTVDLVKSAWSARSNGEDFGKWFCSRQFTSVEEVSLATKMLAAAWLAQTKLSEELLRREQRTPQKRRR